MKSRHTATAYIYTHTYLYRGTRTEARESKSVTAAVAASQGRTLSGISIARADKPQKFQARAFCVCCAAVIMALLAREVNARA